MNFMDYLASLPAMKLDKLYDSNWTCQAVFRSLPPLAKQYVLRLLYISEPIPVADLDNWAKPDAKSKHKAAVNRLEHLRVLLEKKDKSVYLNPPIQKQLRQALSSGGEPPREQAEAQVHVQLPTAKDLDAYAGKHWESMLLQLVSSGYGGETSGASFSPIIWQAFIKGGLLSEPRDGESARITDKGFQFLLLDTNSQLWQIICEYVSAAENRGLDSSQLIAFLLELGFLTVGQAYSTKGFSDMILKLMDDLAILGLLYIAKGKKERLYVPTKLAANLSASLSESASWQPAEGFIMVETNYKVYAYTTSKLQMEILRLFVRIEYRLPNLVVGAITRESVNAAFTAGITAEQIVSYLQKHAHPHVAQRAPVVPPTVSDQIRLWEADRKRLELVPAVIYDEFPPEGKPGGRVYDMSVRHAKDLNMLVWEQPLKRRFAVRAEHHDTMRGFIRQAIKGGN